MRFLSTLVASVLGTLVALGFVFIMGFLFLAALAASSGSTPVVRSGSVLILDLQGAIPEQVSDDPLARALAQDPAYDLYHLKQALRNAAADDRIEGVWLKVHGLSAPWATLEEVRHALETFKESGKPVMASYKEYFVAEGEYFLASVADKVYAEPETFFEFNGLYTSVLFFGRLLDKLEVEPQIIRAGTFKGAVEPFMREDLSAENEEQLAALLASHNETFLEAVAESRGLSADALQQLAEKEAFISALDAREEGLLDGLLFEDQVVEAFKERLGLDPDAALETVEIKTYVEVSPSEAGLEQGRDGSIAIVYAVGTILGGHGTDGSVIGSESFNEAMREAREDDRVQAVVLRINSPGGLAPAADAMRREIALTATAKPVVVSMGDVAASGGYWIATAAETIVAQPSTITGSIGVFSVLFDMSPLLENKLGITHDLVSTSPYADMFSGLRPLSDAERALLQRSTDQTYQTFLKLVAESRGLSVEEVDALAQGRVWSGKQALERGLVDQMGGLETALHLAAQKAGLPDGGYQVRLLPRLPTFFEEITRSLNTQARLLVRRWTLSPADHLLLEQARLLQHLHDLHGSVQALLPLDIRIQ